MPLKDKRVAIMLDQKYQELEVWYPLYRLIEAGAKVSLVASQAGTEYSSKLGYPCVSDVAASDVRGEDFDAVVIPGGWCPDFMRRDASMVEFTKQCVKADIILASICHGPWMLCSTDALKGKRATSFFSIKDDVINAGANWVDEECVVDQKLITARTPNDLPAFMKAVIELLSS
ncbi:MAG: type 1 glutamine amidotransferase [bacterium]|nr:type 1 glutamine amidotransferase [bacterium]